MPVRSPEQLTQIRTAYESTDASVRVLVTMFSTTRSEIYGLARQHGWSKRADTLAATTARERAIAVRAAEAAREADLYGDAVADVRLLRSRGFVVIREGQGYRVGNSVCTLAALRAKAARERRLIEAAHMLAIRHPPEHSVAG